MSEIFDGNDQQNMLDYYRRAIDVNIITSITNGKGNIIYVNDKFCEVSKFSREELIGKNHRIVNSKHHPKDFFVELWKTISEGNLWHGEIKNKAKDGSFYWVDSVIIPVTRDNERQYLSLRTLITERKELEKKKEEYMNSLENVVFLVSHKIRKPLVSILGLMEMNIETITKDELEKIVGFYKKSAEELNLFTNELNSYLESLKNKLDQ